jgi:hypothetical protein
MNRCKSLMAAMMSRSQSALPSGMPIPSAAPTRLLSRVAVRGVVAVALVASVALAGCSSGDDTRTLVIEQDAPALASFRGPAPAGPANGDGDSDRGLNVLAFDARITDADGTEGVLIGYLLTTDLPDGSGTGEVEGRIGTLVYTFGSDELVVSGGTSYPAGEAEMQAGVSQSRVVVGGTGAYLGARGEVVTVRNSDGTYTHTFTLLD